MTAEALNAIYAALLRDYYGDVIDEEPVSRRDVGAHPALLQHAVLRLPVRHLLRVDRAADAGPPLRRRRRARADGVERYLSLLRAGGSDYPMTLLAQAGVDLSQPDTVQAVSRGARHAGRRGSSASSGRSG